MKTILVMEDDKQIAAALAIRLEAAGYQALTAPNGLVGLKMALDDKPDLIVSDIWMPIGIGFSVAERLQELGLAGIPIIFITAGKQEGLRETAKRLGAAGFVEKPYDPEELLITIARVLQKHRGTRSCSDRSRQLLNQR